MPCRAFSSLPPTRRSVSQRGQSMVEFVVALAVLLPLFLAVTYAGKYSDIQQAAVQASRYAVFQRVVQPDGARLPDAKIQDQMRARFFVGGSFLHDNGRIQSNDTAVGLKDKGVPATWRDLAFKPLMATPESVKLSFDSAQLNAGFAEKPLKFMAKSADKPYRDATVARVEVTLVNEMDLSTPKPSPLSFAAATAAVGDSIGSSGSQATREAVSKFAPAVKVPKNVSSFVEKAVLLLEPHGPILGCSKPDVVPNHRLEGYAPAGKCR